MKITEPEKLLIKTSQILEGLKIKYFVTGGLAVSVWGRPRATFDIDIVIELIEPEVIPLAKALRKMSKAGYFNEKAAMEAIRIKGEFNFIEPESGLKVDFWVNKNNELSLLEFRRRRQKKIDNYNIYFVSPEDLILNKLQWYRESKSTRQLEDIESILNISGKKLDMKYLKQWAIKLGVKRVLDKLLNKKVAH